MAGNEGSLIQTEYFIISLWWNTLEIKTFIENSFKANKTPMEMKAIALVARKRSEILWLRCDLCLISIKSTLSHVSERGYCCLYARMCGFQLKQSKEFSKCKHPKWKFTCWNKQNKKKKTFHWTDFSSSHFLFLLSFICWFFVCLSSIVSVVSSVWRLALYIQT